MLSAVKKEKPRVGQMRLGVPRGTFSILNRMIRIQLDDHWAGVLEQNFESGEGVSYMDIWGRSDQKERIYLTSSKNSREVRME